MEKQVLKIVKVGGKLIEKEADMKAFLADFSALKGPKILIHGGGKMATEMSEKLGYKTNMVDGRRITDANAMQVITMVYAGLINKQIVTKLQSLGTNSVGLCGADGNAIISKKREVKEIDYGFVGDIENINTSFINSFLKQGIAPIFSAVSSNLDGQLFNTNADSIAAELAIAFSEMYNTELLFCFEKPGVLKDPADDASVIQVLSKQNYDELLEEKIVSEGMLPKLLNCFYALENKVSNVLLGGKDLLQNDTLHTKITK